jgi:glutamate racemase
VACPLLVPLIEEGLLDDEITRTMLRRYLEPLLRAGIDTLVLGCTHYPLLKRVIARLCGKQVLLVDSAENCALAVRALITPTSHPETSGDENSRLDVVLTDSSEGFLRIAEKSLDLTIDSLRIRMVGN